MPISPYIRALRDKVGTTLLMLPAVGGLIWNDQGQILLELRHDNHRWDVPSGAMNPGEHPAQTLVREVWEETGLRVVPWRLAAVLGGEDLRITYPNGDQTEYLGVLFDCRVVGGSLHCQDGEALELRWFDPADMPPIHVTFPSWVFDRERTSDPYLWNPTWLDGLD